MSHPRMDFNTLIAPMAPDEFFGTYWQQELLLHTKGSPDRIAGLLSLQDVDFLVSSLPAADSSSMMLIANAKPLPSVLYTNKEGLVDLAAVYRAYASGHTLLILNLEKRWKSVGWLCRDVETSFTNHGVALRKSVVANMYLTPANCHAFPAHYDHHDTLIVQLEGTKHWRIYGPLDPFPIELQAIPLSPDKLPPVQQEFIAAPGHVFYIPRGFYHGAQTAGDYSLHLTIGIYPSIWVDLITRLLITDSRLREALPIACFNRGHVTEEFVRQFKQRIDSLSHREDVEEISLSLFNGFLDNVGAAADSGFQQLNNYKSVNLDTRVKRRAGTSARIARDSGELRLLFSGGGFGGSEHLEPVFRFIIDSKIFAVRELPGVPSDEIKLQIVRELIREGLLKIVETEVAQGRST